MKVQFGGAPSRKRHALKIGAVSATAAMLLTACAGGGSATQENSPTGESGDSKDLSKGGSSTITMWVDAVRAPALKDISAKFKKETGITVKLVQKDFASIRDDFITQVPSGNGPDVIVGPHDWIGKFVQNGVIAPVELGEKADEFQDSAIEAMTYQGSTYGVPYSVENIGLLRNTELVTEPAETFKEVIANGQQVVEAGNAEFPFLLGLDPSQGDPYHLYPFQTSMGVPVFGKDETGSYDPDKLMLGAPNGVEFAKKLVHWGDTGLGVLNSNITVDIAKTKFLAGESPYFLTGPWNVQAAQEAGIEVAVDPLPTVGDKPARPFIGVNGFYISSKSKNALAANEFVVNYLSTEAVQDALFDIGGRPPALKASFEKAAEDPIVAAFGEIGKNGVPMPAIPAMDAVWADWGATEMALIKGKGNPEKLWKDMVANIESKIGG